MNYGKMPLGISFDGRLVVTVKNIAKYHLSTMFVMHKRYPYTLS